MIIFRCQHCSFIGVIGSQEQKNHNCVKYLTSQLEGAQSEIQHLRNMYETQTGQPCTGQGVNS